MCNQSVLKVLVFGLTVAGFSLAVTSTFTNYWVKIPANNGHAGLWQNCTTKQNDPKDILCWDTDNKSKYLVSAKVFMNMGWIAYGFSLVVYVLSHLKYLKYTTCGTLLIMTEPVSKNDLNKAIYNELLVEKNHRIILRQNCKQVIKRFEMSQNFLNVYP
nr:uncharacterized protein LOC124818370 isoform X2 [Hydra vulgaris]